MSDRLAISASFSVLMMAMYVLFGNESVRVPFGPDQFEAPLGQPSASIHAAPARHYRFGQ